MHGGLSFALFLCITLSVCYAPSLSPLYSFSRTFPLGVSALLWEYDYLRRISAQTWPVNVKASYLLKSHHTYCI